MIRTASRDASMQNAVRNGWPIFVGRSGGIADAAEQFRLYRDALDIARERYARGEINADEYAALRRDLGGEEDTGARPDGQARTGE